jgi:hypothetical protein
MGKKFYPSSPGKRNNIMMKVAQLRLVKTRSEVEALKVRWTLHPEGRIEETPGYEEYREELLDYRVNQGVIWKAHLIEMGVWK